MLKKLRLKFIMINMAIVTVMLTAIFCLLYFSTGLSLKRESLRMMESVVSDPFQMTLPPQRGMNINRLPFFSVEITSSGEIILNKGSFNFSNENDLLEIIESAEKKNNDTGVLKEYNLRYLKKDTQNGKNIIFSDISSEKTTLKNLVKTFLIIGSISFCVFLIISILLAKWAVKPVEEAWKQQKQFVSDASHELKTPLTVIMADAELLTSPECSENEYKSLGNGILTMSKQMRGLVESMLELARIDNGTVKEEMASLSFSIIATNESMLFEPLLFEKGFKFNYYISPDIVVKGISSHLKQLVDIFLDNASKYTYPGGEICLSLKLSDKNHCLFEVTDQGDPINSEDLNNIFKRFYRADKARAMNQSFGLGLSIAKEIAEEHHGKIWAESRNGYNSFFVELPIIK